MKLKKPKFWDHKKPSFFSYLLLPFSIILGLITKIKSKPKFSNSKIKTICVGNIYIGGTGKTSLAIKIKEILDKNNIRACFIKKFYPNQTDEQKLLSKNGVLFSNLKRITALNEAISEGFEVAIFDDGLQDSTIKYDLEIVCFNNLNWIGNGLTLPSGPLRENINNLKSYENVFLNGNEESLIAIKEQIKRINPNININSGKYIPLNIDEFDKDQNYLVFSGIGNHKTFVEMLKNNKLKIVSDLEYPDHYQYSKKDFDEIIINAKKFNAHIITTEKDYLRLENLNKNEIFYVKSSLDISDEKNLTNKLIKLNEKN
ncbi:tetraacyldisaccharide 4'-kinase [Candidatus Pelagibacter communis]|uniref:Tetraacyldisaccharide 4'-kinase n=1 Tax=Pelagibacter ubique (strain HTCC1062) TaxID=335992 RepID=LPXK_PELUB|nr:tetraacyldisaccharide 4'-kinase [Candidatus Pelagibacter ubique]Q4FPB7.1 RecName: Full=Tetraacyldisaccharide 4'-kinase; AltName: Full=Lipid A 4'-kinase [Candidatus Pelagibacter ubique HTCC1062]AAZ20972.1 tetraacyldisaccharide 4'-kinase [Candidatus Pelagibacter ubique HTCC1062]